VTSLAACISLGETLASWRLGGSSGVRRERLTVRRDRFKSLALSWYNSAMPDPNAPPSAVVGSVVPEFELKTVDGKPFKSSVLKNRVYVLVFGSYSCPSFRHRAAGLEKLRKELGGRATVLVVYTKEAHPIDEWDAARNKDEGVQVEQPTTPAARKALALQARDTLKLSPLVLIDSMDDKLASSFGLLPNGAVVVGRDGTIVARQKWFEPGALRRKIDQAVQITPTTKPTR